VSDPTASGDLVSAEVYERLVLPRARALIGRIRASAKVTVIYHICGNTTNRLGRMADTGTDIISVDSKVDLAAAKAAVGDRVCLMGNLDPVGLMLNGTPAAIRAEATRCLGLFDRSGGFVLSGGCALPAATLAENIRALVAAAREHRR
jgi:uroporphyrinogen decarboxylase